MGEVTIIRADAQSLPLADASVDLVVTSPPYFALRSYTDGGEHYAGQIGSEATPAEYIANLIDCTREWVRVLKPSGSIWVNLGDKYNSAASGQNGSNPKTLRRPRKERVMERGMAVRAVPPKSLLGLPWRYALACIDELGLILRAEVIWSKPNGLPESVTDRVRRSHETWFHLTRSPRYFSAVDEIREEYQAPNATRTMGAVDISRGDYGKPAQRRNATDTMNPLGKLPGSVWDIASQPLTVPKELGIDHFAAFPTEWPRRIILGWSPSGICLECGEGRQPTANRSMGPDAQGRMGRPHGGDSHLRAHRVERKMQDGLTLRTITGYACACPEPTAPTHPAVVLDPFGGTGTTALVAKALGRHGISVDMSADYCRLAQWRTSDPGELAKAMRVDKPPPVMDGQLSLLDLVASAEGSA